MNFLAHMLLSGNDTEIITGNYVADFISNKEVKDYPKGIQNGIIIHRQIDSYTDAHPLVKQSTGRLREHYHKYAPVVIDILYDYVLVQNWDKYAEKDIQNFCNMIYQALEASFEWMPEKLVNRTKGMIQSNWLVKYGTEQGINKTFEYLDKRTRFPTNFENAFTIFMEEYDAYEKEFNSFFPDLIKTLPHLLNNINFYQD
jgi:acyl carrier protein phosphodiesterase